MKAIRIIAKIVSGILAFFVALLTATILVIVSMAHKIR